VVVGRLGVFAYSEEPVERVGSGWDGSQRLGSSSVVRDLRRVGVVSDVGDRSTEPKWDLWSVGDPPLPVEAITSCAVGDTFDLARFKVDLDPVGLQQLDHMNHPL